jgi:hypothetical protein
MSNLSKDTPSEFDTIQRCPHDQDNNYTMLSNDLIRDNSISLNCRMVLICLLSNKNTWSISISQLQIQHKEYLGRDALYGVINEAIKAGYIKREEYIVKGLKRYKYYLSERPKFKKSLPCPEIPYTADQDTKEVIYKEKIYISNNPPLTPPSLPSPPKERISLRSEEEDFFIHKILENEERLEKKEKVRLTKNYSEAQVKKALEISKTQVIKSSLMGLLINILNNPDQWQQKPEDKPVAKKSFKEQIFDRFKKGERYNGFEFTGDDIGPGFLHPNGIHCYGLNWKEADLGFKWQQLLDRLGIK